MPRGIPNPPEYREASEQRRREAEDRKQRAMLCREGRLKDLERDLRAARELIADLEAQIARATPAPALAIPTAVEIAARLGEVLVDPLAKSGDVVAAARTLLEAQGVLRGGLAGGEGEGAPEDRTLTALRALLGGGGA